MTNDWSIIKYDNHIDSQGSLKKKKTTNSNHKWYKLVKNLWGFNRWNNLNNWIRPVFKLKLENYLRKALNLLPSK